MQIQPTALSETGTAICMASIFLVPLVGAGLALVNTGFGRGRSAAHSMLSAMCVFAVAVLVYLFIGFGFQGFAGEPAHLVNLGDGNGMCWEPNG